MKKFVSMLLVLVLCLSVTACGSIFSSGDADSGNADSGKKESTDIQITDSFTHVDPEGMEYAARYAYTSGKNEPGLVEGFKQNYNLDIVEQLMIIYADKDDKPLAQYEYFVMANEEQAKECAEQLGADLSTTQGNVTIMVSDAATTQSMIDMNMQFGSLSENSCKAYAESMKDVYMFMDVE